MTIEGNYETALSLVKQAVEASSYYGLPNFDHTAWRTLTLATLCMGDRTQALRHAQTGLRGLIENYSARDAAQWLPIAALLLAEDGKKEYAVELMGLLFSHPDSITGWLERWPLWSQFRQDLEATLSPDDYAAAWDRGTALDLQTVVVQLLEEFSEAVS